MARTTFTSARASEGGQLDRQCNPVDTCDERFAAFQQYETRPSGLIGKAHYEGDLSEMCYWLAWGSVLHIGKNVVKGNGWYEISPMEQ